MRAIIAVTMCLSVATSASASASGPQIALRVVPAVSVVDAPLSIRVVHAAPGARIRIRAGTTMFGRKFESSATFVANSRGEVNPRKSAPITGSYQGIDGMGLFWSMVPKKTGAVASGSGKPFDYLAPRNVTLRASDGRQEAARTITRIAVGQDIRYVDLRRPGLYGRFYRHTGPRRLPVIVVVGGAEGGVPEDRPAILASHGFNAFALAYFGADGLPSGLANIPIEDVRNAITWLQHQPTVDSTRIGIVGGSKGAELALLAASRFSQIRSVVAFSPSSVVYPGLFYGKGSGLAPSSWSYRGRPLPYVDGKVPKGVEARIDSDIRAGRPVSYAPEYLAELENATNLRSADIAVERINGPVMLISGDDDRLWPSTFMARAIMRRLGSFPRRPKDIWLRYARAGHEIGEPYYTYSDSTLAHLPRYVMALGGSPRANATASADAWPRVVSFLESSLGAMP